MEDMEESAIPWVDILVVMTIAVLIVLKLKT